MLSKIRTTTIITLVAAFSFAGAANIPTVAQARRKKPGLSKHVCSELKKIYEMDIQFAKEATSQQEYNLWTNEAFNALYAAEQGGCSWAKREQTIGGTRPESEPPTNAPEPGSPSPRPTPPPPAGAHA